MTKSVITVTCNPCLDRTLFLSSYQIGQVNRVEQSRQSIGGKGINVSRALAVLGQHSLATGFLGGSVGSLIRDQLAGEEFALDFVTCQGETRINTKIVTGSQVAEFNEAGPEITGEEEQALLRTLVFHCQSTEGFLAIAGSLPPGVAPHFYAELITEVRRVNSQIKFVVDASGASLEQACLARPFLIKPNVAELAALSGRSLRTLGDVVEAVYEVLDLGVEHVICSLGPQGALAVSSQVVWRLKVPNILPRNTVGCGDSFLAGLLKGLCEEKALSEALQMAGAAGSASAQEDGVGLSSHRSWRDMLSRMEVNPYVDKNEPVE